MPRKKIRKATDSQAFRILDMLDNLSAGKTFTKEELSLQYEKRVRTIERDIEAINEYKQGMAFINEYGKVAIGPGFTMVQPKLNRSQETSLIELYFVAKNLGVRIHEDLEALFKTLTVDASWEYDNEVVPVMPKQINTSPIDSVILEEIQTAIADYHVIDITYKNNQDKDHKDDKPFPIKDLKPLGIVASDGWLYLQVIKGDDKLSRQYRLDRIKSCKYVEQNREKFPSRRDVEKLLKKSRSIWGMTAKQRKIPLAIKIEGLAREYFQTHELIPGQEVVQKKDGTLLLTAKIGHHMEILPHILRWMPDVQVISPLELKEEVRNKARAFLKK